MSKLWTPRKPTVEMRPSRIRRDPLPAQKPAAQGSGARWDPSERETWIVVVGVILFAIAFALIIVGISDYTSE